MIKQLIQLGLEREIDIALKTQDRLGNKTFKDVWISLGWLSRNKLGTVTFKPIKVKGESK